MAGVSEMPYRVIARQMGASAAPTELVSAKGLMYGQDRTARYLTHDPSVENPFWVQIFGGEPDVMAEGARCAQALGAHILDVNMGCPVKKVTRNGAGSALLCDPVRAASIVEAMHKATGLPVTVKIRSGWDDAHLNTPDFLKRLVDAGVSAFAMHARTKEQAYKGKADWTRIAELVRVVGPVPVIGNGDVDSVESAQRMLAETGCSAVMVGRAALGNPWIFKSLSEGQNFRPSAEERLKQVLYHFEKHMEYVGLESIAVKRFRPHLMWYSHGLRGGGGFRDEVTQIEFYQAVVDACEVFFLSAGADISEQEECAFDTRTALG